MLSQLKTREAENFLKEEAQGDKFLQIFFQEKMNKHKD